MRRYLFGRKEHIRMQVFRPQPSCRTDLHGSFDHGWWPGDIGFPAIEIQQVLVNRIGHEATAPARIQLSIGEDGREGQVGVPLRQIFEMVDEIEISGVARAEIDMDRLLQTAGNGRLDDPFDRRKSRASGDAQDRPRMLLAQVGRAERTFDQHRIANPQLRVDVMGRGPTWHPTNVEFELSLTWPACHRIVAGGCAQKREPSVLARSKDQRDIVVNSELDALDVVCSVLYRRHTKAQTAVRMGRSFLCAVHPGYARIRCGDRTAGEDQPLRLLLGRQSETAVIEKVCFTADEAGLAGPAPAGAAAMRIGDAVGERRFQNRDALRHGDDASRLANIDMLRHGARFRVVLNRHEFFLHHPHNSNECSKQEIKHLRECLAQAGVTLAAYEGK